MPPKCAHPSNEFLVMEMEKLLEQEGAKSHRRVAPGQVNHTISSYQRALHSIRTHPASIETGEQAKALRGVGNFIAQKINAILIRLEAAATYGEEMARHLPPEEDAAPKQKAAAASKKRKATPSNGLVEHPSSGDVSKVYKPAKGKLPWYVIMALWDVGATSEARAVDLSALVTEMKALGFVGTTSQLSTRMSSLINAHHVVAKAVDGGLLYLSLAGTLLSPLHSKCHCMSPGSPTSEWIWTNSPAQCRHAAIRLVHDKPV
ncbi:hypothetical protein AaE_010821 [Aphanomyces astaci]|uniref:Crossover junction endonuclease MUS81-like HHH domain-containing protein n=1 Tax=Aphanomyces astaci TaxID=112090 RepID=A0A6A4ZVI3_APHAT|nr:hypothetical protein AaE_010821 [Aphanomyces astaci]